MRGIGSRARPPSLTILLLAVASMSALLLADLASATAPGSDGKIYYQGPQSGETGPSDIFRVNPDGGEPQDLTAGNGFSGERPNLSADGRHVVFQSFRDEGWNIFSMNADGSGQVDLTKTKFLPEEIINFEPTWSPDGTKVAFMRQSKVKGQDIWVMNSDGSDPVDLTETVGVSEAAPEFSPDGTKIVYISGAGNDDIWVMNANGSSKTQLLDESSPIPSDVLSWLPDGTQIAYKSVAIGGELRLVGASGGPTGLLVENSGADYPSWASVPVAAGGTPPPSTPPASTPPASTTVPSPVSSPGPKVASSAHFVLSRLKLNKKKGTAVLAVSVPGAGTVVLTGKGVKKASAVAKAAGKLSLTIRAAGKAGQKLTETGKAELRLKITFTPAAGVPATKTMTVTLKLSAG
jgi:dipeptidyl aminopeptidase/acylaminoacyl peptidase